MQHDIKVLAKHEIEFLLIVFEEIHRLYQSGGISIKTLCRQHDLTREQIADIIINGQELRANLVQQKAKSPRQSSIFEDNYVLSVLLENRDLIVDCYADGYEREAIYKCLASIPSNRIWTKFRNLLRKQGIKLVQNTTIDGDLIGMTV